MDPKDILREMRLTLPILARSSGVELGYLKQLSAGNALPGPAAREKIAAALERHATALREYSEHLRAALSDDAP
jgi:hypothetical protein